MDEIRRKTEKYESITDRGMSMRCDYFTPISYTEIEFIVYS